MEIRNTRRRRVMLNIEKTRDGDKMVITVEGKIDTTSAPEFEKAVKGEIEEIRELTIDLGKLEYISSAGLRVLLASQKIMNKQGNMVVKNPNDVIMDIFEMTGFADLLNIE